MNREFLLKENNREDHYPDRRCVKKDRRGGHRHKADRGEVAAGEKENAYKAQRKEQRDVFSIDLKAFAVFYEKDESEDQTCRGKS